MEANYPQECFNWGIEEAHDIQNNMCEFNRYIKGWESKVGLRKRAWRAMVCDLTAEGALRHLHERDPLEELRLASLLAQQPTRRLVFDSFDGTRYEVAARIAMRGGEDGAVTVEDAVQAGRDRYVDELGILRRRKDVIITRATEVS